MNPKLYAKLYAKLDTSTQDALWDAVDTLIDAATVTAYDEPSDERFACCLLCGMWEDHADACLVPGLLAWQGAIQRETEADIRRRARDERGTR